MCHTSAAAEQRRGTARERVCVPAAHARGAAQPATSMSLMSSPPLQLPPLPEIGHPESYYARLVHKADRENSPHAREAAKVGQYVTLAIDPHLEWEQKLRYFKHTLRRHCQAPKIASDNVWLFYQSLSELVRRYAGSEALRLASAEQQIMSGRPREALQNAEAAEQTLPRGSTDWIRAGDVALQARAELERERDRN